METFTKQSSVKLLDSETCIDNKVVIYKSRSKAILFILVSLLLTIAGKLFLHHPDYYVVGWSFNYLVRSMSDFRYRHLLRQKTLHYSDRKRYHGNVRYT